MKSRFCFLMLALSFFAGARHAIAQNTAFKYQGQLQNNGNPASGQFSMAFSLFTNSAQGEALVGPVSYDGVGVTNGLFTVMVDFGSTQWNGQSNWLQIAVATNGSVNFSQLSPRQLIAPVPYAIYAESAGNFTGDIATNSLPGFQAPYNTIAGGRAEVTSGLYGTIGGGEINSVAGEYSTVAGGYYNSANYNAATVAGGTYNIASNQNATVGGGYNNISIGSDSGIASGSANFVNSSFGFVGGGQGNSVHSQWGAIGGGSSNFVGGECATLVGGSYNYIAAYGDHSFLGGGVSNLTANSETVVVGGMANSASGVLSAIVGGWANTAPGNSAFVGGGQQNEAFYIASTVGGGLKNTAWSQGSTVAGGEYNLAGAASTYVSADSAVGGGIGNTASGADSVVAGGTNNTASGDGSTISGGSQNNASSEDSVIAGGYQNGATAYYSTVPGGAYNTAGGEYSFAAGQEAQALHLGDFVWADSQSGYFTSTGNDQFLIRAGGGVGIDTTSPSQDLSVNGGVGVDTAGSDNGTLNKAWTLLFGGANGEGIGSNRSSGSSDSFGLDFYTDFGKRMVIQQGGNVGIANANPSQLLVVGNAASPAYCDGQNWVNASDRNAKQDFRSIDSTSLLDKISSLPISEWQYKADTNGQRHIGPMAQDFHAAFGLNGDDDKHISTVDEGGVALAAIQGLNQKLTAENTELRMRLEKLEQLVDKLSNSSPK